jgi:hypothetical protein
MMKFKEYYQSQTQVLEEGKYLQVLKHFGGIAWRLRQIYKSEQSNIETLKKYNVYNKEEDFVSSAEITDLANETRALINNLPEQHRETLTAMVEKISGECIAACGEHIVTRWFETKNYKNYFKLYVLNFFLETLVMHSITDETDFEKIMVGIHEIFVKIGSLNGSVIKDLTTLVLMTPEIITTIGRLVKTLADKM